MNTNKMSREQISALADNELAESQLDMALATLRQPEEQMAWDVYHQIGDVLRSDDMAIAMRPDFASRMAVRLAAEPTFIAPLTGPVPSVARETGRGGKVGVHNRFRRFAIPGAVAAAAASVALITAPQLMVATKGNAVHDNAQIMVASTRSPVSHAAVMSASAAQPVVAAPVATEVGMVLRDPHIDEYLRAHQRFSPSVYSSAQFARSATLGRDSEK